MTHSSSTIQASSFMTEACRGTLLMHVFWAGHGGQTKDLDGDEDDGYDEVIYPVDFRQAGHIVDDEMHRIMVQSLQPGVRLTAIFDSCHSGSALDLPYLYSTQGVLKEPDLAKEAGQGLLGIVSSYAKGDLGGMANTAMSFFKKAMNGDETYQRNLRTKTSPADVIMWSGSKDSQTSSDAQIAGQATGAMSWAFITALKKNPQQSYVQLLNSIRDELEGSYTQKPQLSCSHPLSESVPFPHEDTSNITLPPLLQLEQSEQQSQRRQQQPSSLSSSNPVHPKDDELRNKDYIDPYFLRCQPAICDVNVHASSLHGFTLRFFGFIMSVYQRQKETVGLEVHVQFILWMLRREIGAFEFLIHQVYYSWSMSYVHIQSILSLIHLSICVVIPRTRLV